MAFYVDLIETFKDLHKREPKIVNEIAKLEPKIHSTKQDIKDILQALDIFRGLKSIETQISDCKKIEEKNSATSNLQVDYYFTKIRVFLQEWF